MLKSVSSLEKHNYRIFMLVRIAGVGIRPMILYLCIMLDREALGSLFSLIVTVVPSCFLIFSNQNFRKPYQYFAGESLARRGLGGKTLVITYYQENLSHILIFTPFVFLYCFLWVGDVSIALIFLILCIFEKYYDDDQRVLIYQKRYLLWCSNFIFRVVIPSSSILALMFIVHNGFLLFYFLISFICLIAYIFLFRRTVLILTWYVIKNHLIKLKSFYVSTVRYINSYFKEYLWNQIWVIVSGNIVFIDRFLVTRLYEERLTGYVFLCNVANIIIMFHSLFHYTRIRPVLIDYKGSYFKLYFNRENLLMPLGLLFLLLMSVGVAAKINLLNLELSMSAVFAILASYFIFSTSLVIMEVSFWKLQRFALISLELVIYFIFGFSVLTLSDKVNSIPQLFLLALLLRLVGLLTLLNCFKRNTKLSIDA